DQPTPFVGDADERARQTAHQRVLDTVFGDVLPDTTQDEYDDRPGASRDEDLRSDVPPHHG
ncbi:MAG: hypothetical protein H0T17_01325, partial [Propionibacteriales bacterium]|nr:hypothetical protein [Propionibacteriales bacterium]